MEIYKLQQLWVLGICTLAGILCGIVYDSFRAYRRCFSQTDGAVAVCDVLFWVISAVIVYFAVYISNNAELRWHELIGLIAGFLLYSIYLGRFCMGLLCRLVRFLHKGYIYFLKFMRIPRKVLHILILPLQKAALALQTRILYITHKTIDKTHPEFAFGRIKSGIFGKFANVRKKLMSCKKFF